MTKEQTELLPCPFCGETPKTLGINDGEIYRWKRAFGDCCSEWEIEFRVEYADSENQEKVYQLAVEAWNDKPRLSRKAIQSYWEAKYKREKAELLKQVEKMILNTRHNEGWVSVDDRLPEEHLEVDVECAGFVCPYDTPTETSIGFIGGEGTWSIASWLSDQDCYETLNDVIVTRWKYRNAPPAPLPTPPNNDKQES